ARRLGLVLRRRLHGHRPRASPAREGRDRPDPSRPVGDRLGSRLPLGGDVTHDELVIIGIAAGCSASVGVLGLVAARVFRRASLRWLPAGVAVVAAVAVIAAVVGTARAMFISSRDYSVVLWVCLVAGVVSACF